MFRVESDSAGQPFFERLLALARRLPREEPLHADVLVEIGPVDSFTVANEPPFFLFLRASMSEARIPGDRKQDRAAVAQIDCQRVVSE